MQLGLTLFMALGLSVDAFALFLVIGRLSGSRACDQHGEPVKYEMAWSMES
jgi:hypothetical protein